MTSTLIVSHSANKGGAELFLLDLLRDAESDWRACFLSDGPAVAELAASGHPPIHLPAGKVMMSIRRGSSLRQVMAGIREIFAVARKLASHARHYDAICANSQKAFVVSALAAHMSRRPLVWILHDILTDTSFSAVNRVAVAVLSRIFADRIIVNSKATGRAFVEVCGQSHKVRLVYNGFNADAAAVRNAAHVHSIRADLGLGGAPLVGLFGRLDRWKGQDVLLRALALVNDVQAILVGGSLFGDEEYQDELRQLILELGLSNRVRLLGHRDDVAELMAAVDVVLHTSTAPEPFGRVVVEGMLSRRPVVATSGGGIDEIVRDGINGLLVSPGDPQALARAIRRLVEDVELAERLGREGRTYAADNFSISTSREMFKSVLAEVAARPS